MELPTTSLPPSTPPPTPGGPSKRGLPPQRILAIAGFGAITAGVLVAAVAQALLGSPSPSPVGVEQSPTFEPVRDAVSSPSAAVASVTPEPSAPASAAANPSALTSKPSAVPNLLPVKGTAVELGTEIRMAAGPEGSLYVLVPQSGGTVITLLGPSGKPRPGWPIRVKGEPSCDLLLPVADGSVRVVCDGPPLDGLGSSDRQAYAFDASGRRMAGWPVVVSDAGVGRVVGTDLVVLVEPYQGDTVEDPPPPQPTHLLVIRSDGSMRTGKDVGLPAFDSALFIGPDGTAYGTAHRGTESPESIWTDVTAFGLDGVKAGWPVKVADDDTSELAFDRRGRVYLIAGRLDTVPNRTVVLDTDGRLLPVGSGDLRMVSSNPWNGEGADSPGPPIVAGDGTAYVVDSEGDQTTILALGPTGQPRAGWPFRSKLGMEYSGYCEPDTAGCGHLRTALGVGPGNVLYLFNAAARRTAGGTMVAIKPDGRVRAGWPVVLRRAGSMFWSMAVGSDGVWALALEPEKKGYSASIVSIAPDSTIRWTIPIVQP